MRLLADHPLPIAASTCRGRRSYRFRAACLPRARDSTESATEQGRMFRHSSAASDISAKSTVIPTVMEKSELPDLRCRAPRL
jgi:hypothetical protein